MASKCTTGSSFWIQTNRVVTDNHLQELDLPDASMFSLSVCRVLKGKCFISDLESHL